MAAGHNNHDAYVHGHMDISQNEQTYRGFMAACKWLSLHVLALILFFTLWFAAGVGFLGALVATIIFTAVGIWFIRFFFPPPGKGGH
jgi:hypothetical protein